MNYSPPYHESESQFWPVKIYDSLSSVRDGKS